jgi:hypothetical protein
MLKLQGYSFVWGYGGRGCFNVNVCMCTYMLPNLYSLNSRLDSEIMQLQQEINAVDAVRANLTRNRNKGSPTVPEVG